MCETILNEHRETLIAVAEYLLEHETMDGEEFNYFCDHGTMPPKKPDPRLPDNTIEPPARKISMFIDDDPSAPPTPEQRGEVPEEPAQAAPPETPGKAPAEEEKKPSDSEEPLKTE